MTAARIASPVLLANIGGEELGADARPPRQRVERLVADLANLWGCLFGPGTRHFDGQEIRWPEGIGGSGSPVFDWLPSGPSGVPVGVAWIVTPQAVERLHETGARVWGPAPEVVRSTHDKAFAARVAADLDLVPGCLAPLVEVLDPVALSTRRGVEEIVARIGRWPTWTRHRGLVKPRLGTSGRGQVVVDVGSGEIPRPRVFHRLAGRGGAILEPLLDRVDDLSVQMFVGMDGSVDVVGTTRQVIGESGRYHGNHGLVEGDRTHSGHPLDAVCVAAAVRLARAASAVGYFGPCGVDAFTFAGADGEEILRPIVELNARFTTAMVAVGLVRRVRDAGLEPSRQAWKFLLRAPPAISPDERMMKLGPHSEAPVLTLTSV